MNPEQAYQYLVEKIDVTNQMVTYAKAFMLEHFQENTDHLLTSLLQNVEATKPSQIVIHQSVDTPGLLTKAAKYISWDLASREALWGLITSNLLIQGSSDLADRNGTLDWTTVIPGSGGQSTGWQFNEYSLPVPRKVILRPSGISSYERTLSDPDLFLHEINIEGLNIEIEKSLRESVLCYKNELFLGCLALLGKAAEGAWIELGLAMASAIPTGAPINGVRLKESVEDPFIGIGKKISLVLNAYERRDVFQEIYRESGYKPTDLKSCVVWGDAVRESRNSIHYGAEPSMANSYEKVSALLIGTVPNLKVIYSIVIACNESQA
ncbi:MAG: hypothetical protein U9R60_11245 [Bacteroidota bacterium]|nr:hypothetical protein [Bacteroidota bacterium]